MDGLRGITILLVLGQHALFPGLGRSGTVGVTIFLVLSGFLITTLLLEERLLVFGIPMSLAGSVVLVAPAATGGGRWLSAPLLVYVGVISYGLYLWHGRLLTIGREGDLSIPVVALLVCASLALAIASHELVERPFLRPRGDRAVRLAFLPARPGNWLHARYSSRD